MSTTPFTSPLKPSTTSPATPLTSLRKRNGDSHSSTAYDSSPTNSTLSDSATNITALRLGGDSQAALRNLTGVASQHIAIRSDPSMLTCFDPADKELYELWAPKR
ncbi:hypothetical protein CPB83DRAFT_902222 [Crepidotus variabilis]|uniref:Uncharacterized protein n=1 Tax=Crepidotus variabilis TaxID=179855 RepID=A0A9P6ESL5_9AGAR|nr:hypothetical protein CPB83DRAFT_902222 [Crepidotus variabilis]